MRKNDYNVAGNGGKGDDSMDFNSDSMRQERASSGIVQSISRQLVHISFFFLTNSYKKCLRAAYSKKNHKTYTW